MHPQQPVVTITKKSRSASTPKEKRTPPKKKSSTNSLKKTINAKDSSRTSTSSIVKKNNRYNSTGKNKLMDFTKIPNWKYEVNKLIRVVFRHSVLCSSLREEAARMGGLRILDHYKKNNNT